MFSRRRFLAASASTLLAAKLRAQTARIDVAAVERDRILAAAPGALAAKPTKLNDLSSTIATLTAAFLLTKEDRYASRAIIHLKSLSSFKPQPDVLSLIPLAEAAVALRFFVDIIAESDVAGINGALTSLQSFLQTEPAMLLARDRHDHKASAWLLVSSAIARAQRDDKTLDDNRRFFRKPTLRSQIDALGRFPEELATANPYRNTLFNFDLLCGACQLLASPFDLLWDYELPDGPGMRTAAAFVFPVIVEPSKWPAVSDAEHFREVPRRRPGLLFAGRAYNRAEYVALWRSLPADISPALADSFPIREPLLWMTRAAHGL